MDNQKTIEDRFNTEVAEVQHESDYESYKLSLPTAEVHLTELPEDRDFSWKWVVTGVTPKEQVGSPEWQSGDASSLDEACVEAQQAVWRLTERTREKIQENNKQIEEDIGYLIAMSERLSSKLDRLEKTVIETSENRV